MFRVYLAMGDDAPRLVAELEDVPRGQRALARQDGIWYAAVQVASAGKLRAACWVEADYWPSVKLWERSF